MKKAFEKNAFNRCLTNAWILLFALNLPTGVHAADLYWSGTGTWNTTTQNWGTSNGGPYTDAIWSNLSQDSAIFQGTAGTVTLGGAITAAGLTFAVDGYTVTGNTLTLSGSGPTAVSSGTATISSALGGSLTKSGAGTLTLTANSVYSGNTTVSEGMLNLGGGAFLPNSPAISVASGATLNLYGTSNNQIQSGFTRDTPNNASLAISGTMNVGGAVHTMYASTISMTNGTIDFDNADGFFWMPARTIAFNGGSNAVTGTSSNGFYLGIAGGTLTLDTPLATDAVSFSVPLTAAGGGNLTKSGPGLVSLQGANNQIKTGFSGVWTVNGGTLAVADGTAHTVYGSGITLNDGTLASLGTGISIGSFYFNLSKTITANGANNQISGNQVLGINAAVTMNTPLSTDVLTVSGQMLMGGSLTKSGDGALVLTGDNTAYTGEITISSGTLQFGNGTLGNDGTKGAGAIVNNASVIYNYAGNRTVAYGISGTGPVAKDGAGTLTFSTTKTYTGGTTVSAGTLRLDGGGGQTGLIRGTLTIASGATVQSGGDGTTQWPLGFGNNTQAVGSIVINGGTLNFEAASSNNTGTAAATITMTGGAIAGSQAWDWYSGQTTTPTLETLTAATTATVDNLHLRLTAGGSATFNVAAGAVVGGPTPGVNLRVGTLKDGFDPGAAVIKTGLGVMQFSGVNTYVGPTGVNVGTLLINGNSSAATGVVTVAAGATLGGTGTVGGATTISGTHSPGASPGLQTFTNGLSYTSPSTLVWELSANTAQSADRGAVYDGINLTTAGALAINPAASMSLVFDQSLTDSTPSSVDWTNAFWNDDQQWTIIDVAAPVTWNGTVFGSLTVGSDSLGALLSTVRPNASFSLADDSGNLVLQYVAVPEPGTLALAAAALAAGLGLRRRCEPAE